LERFRRFRKAGFRVPPTLQPPAKVLIFGHPSGDLCRRDAQW
jgi:hypothetical protein